MSSSSPSPVTAASSTPPPSSPRRLPRREIPGGYGGLPFLGAIKDRWDYFYFQGRDDFFKSRVAKYNSTIFRANMPPGPFISPDSRVIVLLDANSFPTLFDVSKVEKRDVFLGTYVPPAAFTGGHRVCPFLDPSEPKHRALKSALLSFLASRHQDIIPVFRACASGLFAGLDGRIEEDGRAEFGPLNEALSLEFVFRLFCDGKSPSSEAQIKSDGPSMLSKWIACQLAPITTLGLPKLLSPIEDLILHTFKLPFFLVRSDYKKLYDAFSSSATSFLDKTESLGIDRKEACHNLVFFAGFNSFGGFKVFFPALLRYVASAGESLHRRLADEIRAVVESEGGVTLNGVQKMALTKSVVYEALRIEPPVPFQYGRAKEDMVVRSHDSEFLVKKGEMIFGYQPFATRDPKVFDDPDEFVPDRFVGEEGEKLLSYVFWSNGRETDEPTVDDKQCPGKDLVVLLSRLLLVEFFLRYDTFSVESSGINLTFLSLTKSTKN